MKIAFIVQADWLQNHFGVRNLFVSCFKILERNGHFVHFVHFEQHCNSVLFWRDIVQDEDLKSNIKETAIGTKKRYEELTKEKCSSISAEKYFLGNCIKNDYDAFIITNPWLINYPLDFGNNPVSLICHDCIANIFALLNVNKSHEWGYLHNAGYQFSLDKNYHFLSNSEKTDKEIIDFYNPKKHSYLPPVLPYAFFDVKYVKEQKKENAILLAAPFDLRKGLLKIPEILNNLKDDFDVLYIYGMPRCGSKLYENFYKQIQVRNIIHYNKITSEDLIELYKKCKILFFPSTEEGLGLPIIEAQLCGCRVVTTNDIPMNQMLCDGGYLLTDNLKTDINNIKRILADERYDYLKLSVLAKTKFQTGAIYNAIMASLT